MHWHLPGQTPTSPGHLSTRRATHRPLLPGPSLERIIAGISTVVAPLGLGAVLFVISGIAFVIGGAEVDSALGDVAPNSVGDEQFWTGDTSSDFNGKLKWDAAYYVFVEEGYEVDVEVSEAIDFANYYAENSLKTIQESKADFTYDGVNLVLSPWNFPIAIPIGGVLASLAAGKRVILKPSQNAAASGYLISKALWEAGIPKSAFAFLPANEDALDPLLTDPKTFDAVILTGGTDTANPTKFYNDEIRKSIG